MTKIMSETTEESLLYVLKKLLEIVVSSYMFSRVKQYNSMAFSRDEVLLLT